MNTKTGVHRVVNPAPGRRVMINMLNLAGQKHSMYSLLEVDVTMVRQFISEYKKTHWQVYPFKFPHQMVAYYHQKSDRPEILTIEQLLDVLKLTIEWIRNGGE